MVNTVVQNKKSISCYDDKKVILEDNIAIEPLGNYFIVLSEIVIEFRNKLFTLAFG